VEERDPSTSNQTIEEHNDGIYVVRQLTGSSSNKPYRCPGCDQMIPMATPHIVAWIEGDEDSRRHWDPISTRMGRKWDPNDDNV